MTEFYIDDFFIVLKQRKHFRLLFARTLRCVYFVFFLINLNAYGQGPGSTWEYKRNLSLAPATTLANFQVKVMLTPGVYSHINNDGSDLRFYDNSNVNCSYWIERWKNSDTSVIWVNVPTVGSNSVTMYYGNPSAPAVSNGNTTFDFFDDFLGTSLNANWTSITTNGTVLVGSGNVSIINTSGGSNGGGAGIYSSFNPASASFIIEAKHNDGGHSRNRLYALDAANPSGNGGGNATIGFDYGFFDNQLYWNGFFGATQINVDYLTRWDITDGGNYQWSNYIYNYANGTQISNNATTTTKLIRYLSFRVTEQNNTSINVDWARVRKAGNTIASAAGSENSNLPVPAITGFSPASGCEGSNITINGSGLNSVFGVTVKIGGMPVTSITSNNGSTLTAVIAAGTTGLVSVTTSGGTGTSASSFTVSLKSYADAGAGLPDICQGSSSAPLGGSVSGSATSGTWSDGSIGGTFLPGATALNATWRPPVGYFGTATLTLTPSTSACGTASSSKTEKVNAIPAGNITVSSNSICAGSPVTFTAPGGYATYIWKVNGTIVQGPGNSNTYASGNLSSGATVTALLSAASGCSATITAPAVSVNAAPAGNLSIDENSGIAANDNRICQGDAVNLSFDNPSSNTNFNFKANGISLYSGLNPFFSAYTVTNGAALTVDVTGPGGCIKTFGSQSITVDALPMATLTGTENSGSTANDNIICQGATVNFTATPGFSVYNFMVDNVSVQTGSLNTFSTATLQDGDFVSVMVTNADSCSHLNGYAAFTVKPLPAAPNINAGGPTTFCPGGNVILTSSAAGNYQWYLNGNAIGSATSQTYNASVAGNYTVSTSNNNGCAAFSGPVSIAISPLPAASSVTASGSTSFCTGGTVTLNASSATAYQWNINSSPISGATTQSYVASIAGNYTVTISNVNGCQNTSSAITVTVNAMPTAPAIMASGSVTFCEGGNVTLTSSAATTYQWYKNSVIIAGATGKNYIANVSGDYSVSITNGNGCGASSGTTTVTVNPLPDPTLTGPNPICPGSTATYFTETGMGINNYTWTFTGGIRIDGGGINDDSIKIQWDASTDAKSVFVNYKNNFGCSASEDKTVTTSNNPLPSITGSSGACINYAGNVYTTQEGNGEHAYVWTVTGGTITSGGGSADNEATITWTSAGTQSVSVNYLNGSECTAVSPTKFNVTVKPLPIANFNYVGSPYCANSADPLPTLDSGARTGSWSSTPGLSINAATGEISLASSTPGIYTITNTIDTSGGCSIVTATSSLTITALPNAFVNYAGAPFCNSDASVKSISITGTGAYSGGIFNAPGGITLNTASGDITPSTSTPGNYIITYSIPASNGCPQVPVTTMVTITSLPSVAISYPGTPFCHSVGTSQSVARSGSGTYMGGSYSASPAGLSIEASTGAIIPGSSTPGSYTVTYTTAAASGCGPVMANTNVIISDVPSATVAYLGSPYCSSVNSAPVTISGTGAYSGGTYSSGSGLIINSATGTVNPSMSTSGTYLVTYTLSSASGCSVMPVTSSITITGKPLVNAGSPVATCANGGATNITLNATDSNIASVTWTSSGTGTFTNANSISNALYTPSLADTAAHTVSLMLTATGNSGCSSVSSVKTLTINTNPAPVIIKPTNPVFCLGGISSLTSVKDAVSSFTNTFNSTINNVSIPDNNFTGINNTIAVSGIPANAIVDSITVTFDITHPNDMDLTGNITAPNLKTLNLINSLSGANFTSTVISSASSRPIQTFGAPPYTGTFAPNAVVGALGVAFATSFNNLYTTSSSLNGNWVLRIADNGLGQTGTLNSWSVKINYSVPVVPVPVTWSPYTDLYKDAAATIPYAGDTLSTIYTKPSSQGTKVYTATSSSATGCSTSTNVTVTVNPSPVVAISADYCSNPGSVTLTANAGTASSYNWSNGATTQTTLVDLAHIYYVSATNGNGCVGTASINIAQELVVNGDFTQGNIGFTTGYNYKPNDGTGNELVDDSGNNGYSVDKDAHNYHPSFYGKDHTNNQAGNRNFLMVNGHGTITIWQETVAVQPNTNYYYSAWAMNLNPGSPARLQFQVNGVNIGTIADLNVADKPTSDAQVNLNNWVRFYYGNTSGWYSGSNTTATIRIVDLNSDLGGNDFGIDDISFATLSPFITGPLVSGTDNQVVCVQSPIDSIAYKVGSGATGPQVNGLPHGVNYSFDGLNLIISGTPDTSGIFKYIISSGGSCPNPKADTGVIIVNPKATVALGSANNTQSVCINSNIAGITYIIGGGGTGVQFINLPTGVSGAYLNGSATISGAPSVPGTFNYMVKTTGACKQDSATGTITILNPAIPGSVSSPTICIGASGSVTLTGYTGNVLQWESSPDGITYSIIANTSNTQIFSNATQTTFYRALVSNNTCPSVYSSGGKIKISNLWEGKFSSDWNIASNWSSGNLPNNTCSGTATIPKVTGVNFNPVLTGVGTVTNLNILTNGNLMVSGGTLQISGTISNSGIFDVTSGTVELNGSTGQAIATGTFTGNAIKNLVISNTAGVTLGGQLDVYGSLTYNKNGAVLNTGGNLTLKSTISQTAWVGDMTSHTINGAVTVERYIATGLGSAPNHGKSWQLLAVPTQGQSIKQSWQEGATATNIASPAPGSAGNLVPGYGTMITSDVAGAATQPTPGFDAMTTPGPSMKVYDYATGNYIGPASTSLPVYNQKGYFTFVRGDRSVSVYNQSATPTILRTKGTLFTPANLPPVTTVLAGKFESVGNPYAAPVDIRNVTLGGGTQKIFIVWDPRLGGIYNYGAFQYIAYNPGTGNYEVSPGGGSYGAGGTVNNYVQSGQAFLVQAFGSNGTVTFSESAKAGNATFTSIFTRQASGATVTTGSSNQQGTLRTSLNTVNADGSTKDLVDGVLDQFDDSYSNTVDGLDARKTGNTGENLSVKTTGTLLAIERRHTVVQDDTIHLNLTGERVQQYRYHFEAQNMSTTAQGFVIDNYKQTRTPLNLNGATDYDFSVENVAGSYAADRFMIVFSPLKALPVTFTSIKAYRQDKNIAVEWRVSNENNIKQYQAEKSVNGKDFTLLTTQKPTNNNGGSAVYTATDTKPVTGDNYYRIRSVDVNGAISYTTIVEVTVAEIRQEININPNPITDGQIHLQFINEPAGKYGLRLLNSLGQAIMAKQVTRQEGTSTELIRWDFNLAHGLYKLEVTKPDGSIKIINVLY